MKNKIISVLGVSVLFSLLSLNTAFAHCDTLNGPVITAAKKAIESKNVNLVLIWVKNSEEYKVKEMFQKTIIDRNANLAEKDRIDMLFFENLVRIHREGEGVYFDGIKAIDTKIDPVIIQADEAIETGLVTSLLKEMNAELSESIQKDFTEVMKKKNYNPNDVNSGREYVDSYVKFLHRIEMLNASDHEQGIDSHLKEESHLKGEASLETKLHISWLVIGFLSLLLIAVLVHRIRSGKKK